MPFIHREQFIWEFSRIGKTPSIYKSFSYKNQNFINEDSNTENASRVISVTLFPTYLTPTLVDDNKYILKKINHKNYSGVGVDVTDAKSIDDFLLKELKSQTRKNLKRTINRLEHCFNISYAYYFGDITEQKLSFLLNNLKIMLEKRFGQKGMVSFFLNEWGKNIEDLLSLVNSKKASLFVVYDGKKPISISVNRHYKNKLLFSDCNGYDLDYSKFGLGHLDNYLLVKWCIENQYSFLDLGIGAVEYKKKWGNVYYDFQYHIYRKKNSIPAWFVSGLEIKKIRVKNLAKTLKVDVLLKKLKAAYYRPPYLKSEVDEHTFEMTAVETQHNIDFNKLTKLDIDLPEVQPLRLTIYNYLYIHQLNINSITLYKATDQRRDFFLKTPKENLKIESHFNLPTESA